MALVLQALFAFTSLALGVSAGSFPPTPEGLSNVQSQKFPGISVSYKETTICERTEGVKGYSGYVHLPPAPEKNRNYPTNIWFWFFAARNNSQSAPLSVWLQGGPGVPSATSAVSENGPCKVLPDSWSTENNPWSWNNKVNMLYIDQPIQVGFSYDTLINGTLDEIASPFNYTLADFSEGVPETNLTFFTGTFASKEFSNSWNTTIAGAPVMWDFMQSFLQDFPEYNSSTNSLSFWGESYGGHYIPTYANYFSEQNERLAASNCTEEREIEIRIDTVGLLNACIDNIQMESYPEFAFNNTYGIQAINESYYQSALEAVGTCRNLSSTCVGLANEKDPQGFGNVPEVNKACLTAYSYCFSSLHDGYNASLNLFDVAAPKYPLHYHPSKAPAGYFNNATVQQALGIPLNFTGNSVPISTGFFMTGDFIRTHGIANLRSLLAKGTKVALVYGDRDYQCNWMGGEAISNALSSSSGGFDAAGYTAIQTNSSYVGGLVRQAGKLSFSRVFQAGHEVPYYQPETAYQIFNRVMFGADVATGSEDMKGYVSEGVASAWSESALPEPKGKTQCYVWDVLETCTPAEVAVLGSGKAITEDFILVGQEEE